MKPELNSEWKRASIFVYEKKAVSPSSTILNRNKSTNLGLFYSDLKITGCVGRAGTATFLVTNTGGAATAEWSLFTDSNAALNETTTQKYVAIILGHDVIWSGKILRSVSKTQPIYSSSLKFNQWEVECESDIGKMKLQAVSEAKTVTGTIGEVVTQVVKRKDATDIDWSGEIAGSSPPIWEGIISNEGANLTFNILDSDMYTQFMALAKVSGFEWRTRLQTYVGTYGTNGWNGTTIVNLDSNDFTPYTAIDAFKGKPVLLMYDTTNGGTPNTWGINSYGYCTTSATPDNYKITLGSVVNGGYAPTSDGWFVVLLDPVLDLSWDLEQPTPVQWLLVNRTADNSSFCCYNYNDKTDKKLVATKVTVKGKNIDTSLSNTGKSDSISTSLYAMTKWDQTRTMFDYASVVTSRMDGYVYSCTPSGTQTLKLIGHDYALSSGDTFCLLGRASDMSTQYCIDIVIDSTPTEQVETDGTPTTTITTVGAIDATVSVKAPYAKYSILFADKTYVKEYDPFWVSPFSSDVGSVYCGGGGVSKNIASHGVSSVYGKYIYGKTSLAGNYWGYPLLPGCYISRANNAVGGTTIDGSPFKLMGLIAVTDTVEQATTRGDLELYATQALINHSFYLRKGSFTCFVNDFLKPGERGVNQLYDWQLIKEGDRIAVRPSQTLPIGDTMYTKSFDGQYKYQWEVISWSLDCNTMQVSVELGDYEPNVYTLMTAKTAAIDRTIS
jgi:hypothetical protein